MHTSEDAALSVVSADQESIAPAEHQLIDVLRERERVIADEIGRRDRAQHLARLKEVSERIVDLQKQLPDPIDPQLQHFLARCSYEKALAFLEAKVLRPNENTTRRSIAR